MSSNNYEFEVKMTCGGCSGAVERVLKRMDGVTAYTTNLETQKVNVTTNPEVELEAVEAVIKKTGKAVLSSKKV